MHAVFIFRQDAIHIPSWFILLGWNSLRIYSIYGNAKNTHLSQRRTYSRSLGVLTKIFSNYIRSCTSAYDGKLEVLSTTMSVIRHFVTVNFDWFLWTPKFILQFRSFFFRSSFKTCFRHQSFFLFNEFYGHFMSISNASRSDGKSHKTIVTRFNAHCQICFPSETLLHHRTQISVSQRDRGFNHEHKTTTPSVGR